jgi:hypothetical protein
VVALSRNDYATWPNKIYPGESTPAARTGMVTHSVYRRTDFGTLIQAIVTPTNKKGQAKEKRAQPHPISGGGSPVTFFGFVKSGKN